MSSVFFNLWASHVALLVKNPPANAGHTRDMGSLPGLGRFPGVGNGTPVVFLPGKLHSQRNLAVHGPGYSPWDFKESDTTEHAHMRVCIHTHFLAHSLALVALCCILNHLHTRVT